jgi:UDPglucose 6-dehydrogenase
MHVGVVGTGYVGLVLGACLADAGNVVVCEDVNVQKVEGLRNNKLPIYEPGLEELVARNQRAGRLTFSAERGAAARNSDVIFIAVGTPPDEDGSADLTYVLEAARTIAQHATREFVVVTKSTVPVGTANRVAGELAAHATHPWHVASNPEFLKEGAAVEDFMRPDRVVVGASSKYAEARLTELYTPFVRSGKPLLVMDIASAEMTKYAANAMLATRISFMNEIARLCERTGANVDLVRKGMGSDPRIGNAFLFAGPGYGGSCFPKDVQALARTGASVGVPMTLIEQVERVNQEQKTLAAQKLSAMFGGRMAGRSVAIWGLAFKPQTDDMREAPALTLIESLLADGATVRAHDPEAKHEARRRLGDRVALTDDPYQACDGADALVLMTEWNEYRAPEWPRVQRLMRAPFLLDMRNLYEPARMRELGFTYDSLGRTTPAPTDA